MSMDSEGAVVHEAGKLPMSFDGIEQIVDAEGDLTKVLYIDEAQGSGNGLADPGMEVGAPGHRDASSRALATVQVHLVIQDLSLQYHYVTVQAQMESQQVGHALHTVGGSMTDGSPVLYSSAAA